MNLSNLITEAQRLAGRVDVEWQTRTRRFINEALEQWAIKTPWPTLRRTERFRTKGTREHIFPQRVLTVEWIGDRTNGGPIIAHDNWDREFPTSYLGDTPGRAYLWRPMGVVPVTSQPSESTSFAVRTGSSDVFSVYVSGYSLDTTASGTPDYQFFAQEQINVTGSGPASGTKQFLVIQTIGKDDFTPADVVVYNASNPIARIQAHKFRSEYRRIEFLHIPPANTELEVGYIVAPEPLVDSHQTPHPAVDPEYLIWYAAALIHEAQQQVEQANVKFARAEQIYQTRIYKEQMHGDRDIRAIPEFNYWNDEDQYNSQIL